MHMCMYMYVYVHVYYVHASNSQRMNRMWKFIYPRRASSRPAGAPAGARYTILHYTILYYTILYYTMIWYDMIWYDILWYNTLCYNILCLIICYTILLYYIIWYRHAADPASRRRRGGKGSRGFSWKWDREILKRGGDLLKWNEIGRSWRESEIFWGEIGNSGMWCLRLWGLNIIVDWPSTTEGVGTSHLKLMWLRLFKLIVWNPTSWNTTSLSTQWEGGGRSAGVRRLHTCNLLDFPRQEIPKGGSGKRHEFK